MENNNRKGKWRVVRKKPITVRAIHFTEESKDKVFAAVKAHDQCIKSSTTRDGKPCLLIPTPQGDLLVHIGDWIIQGIQGMLYPVENDIFESTYEVLEEIKWN